MATEKNLKEAFAGESQANRMYLAFAKKAESDGYAQIAKLFRAAAAAETVHAHAHFRVMGGVKDTAANLKSAIDGEGYEFQKMYPGFLSEAEKEKNAPAAVSFRNALAVEKIHHDLYRPAQRARAEPQAGHLRLRDLRQYGVRARAGQVLGLRRLEGEVHEGPVGTPAPSFPRERRKEGDHG